MPTENQVARVRVYLTVPWLKGDAEKIAHLIYDDAAPIETVQLFNAVARDGELRGMAGVVAQTHRLYEKEA